MWRGLRVGGVGAGTHGAAVHGNLAEDAVVDVLFAQALEVGKGARGEFAVADRAFIFFGNAGGWW